MKFPARLIFWFFILTQTSVAFGHYHPHAKRTETDFSGLITHYRYDAANRLIEKTDPDNTRHAYQYDETGLLLKKLSKPPGKGQKTIATDYAYNANGQLTSADNGEAQLEYTYDALGRVLNESLNGQTIKSHYRSGEQQNIQGTRYLIIFILSFRPRFFLFQFSV